LPKESQGEGGREGGREGEREGDKKKKVERNDGNASNAT